MTPTQREAALRLISALDDDSISRINDLVVLNDAIELLRELAAEPVQEPVCWGWRVPDGRITMIFSERKDNPDVEVVALYAAPPQRELASEPQAEPVRECADNDSPWLICKPCAAVGRCAKLPVAWRSKERINGEFDSGWKLTSNEPPQTPRTIAIEPLYTHPPQQRKPLTDEQILTAAGRLPGWLRHHEELDCDDLSDFARAVEAAHNIGEAA